MVICLNEMGFGCEEPHKLEKFAYKLKFPSVQT